MVAQNVTGSESILKNAEIRKPKIGGHTPKIDDKEDISKKKRKKRKKGKKKKAAAHSRISIV